MGIVVEVNPVRNVLRRMQLEFDDALVGQGRQLKFSFLWFSQVFSKKTWACIHRGI
jgi:hypothetical protein